MGETTGRDRGGIWRGLGPLWAGGLYALFHSMAFPPVDSFETAFFFLVPFMLWAYLKPGWKAYALTAFFSSWLSWAFLLSWLRHVPEAAGMAGAVVLGWGLVLLLSSLVALFPTAFLIGMRWLLPRLNHRHGAERVLGMVVLGGIWVILEWVRTWFIFGFPWLPLASSQWGNPVILQVAAYTGAYGVSFLMVLLNLGLGAYLWKIITVKRGTKWHRRLCPEFYTGVGALLLVLVLYVQTLPRGGDVVFSFRAGVVQPNVPQTLKWEPGEAREILEILQRQSTLINQLDPHVLLWPESSTPNPVVGRYSLRAWIEDLVEYLETPLLMGNLLEEDGLWYNGIFAVEPGRGLVDRHYRKQRLVPFGEYVPFRRWLPFLSKFIPLEGDFTPGQEPTLVPVRINHRTWNVGGLVCYEDIFPGLAREMAREGAEFFFVATNNGWFGQEGAAYQHATHSVLRAVETGRPFLRCGNDGWSGYIDERGHRRDVIRNHRNTIYFRGGHVMEIYRNRAYERSQTFYVRYGDWFVWFCFLAVAAGGYLLRRELPPPPRELEDPDLMPQVGRLQRRKIPGRD